MKQQPKDSTHGNCKLNDTQAIQIRDLLIEGELSFKQIAEMFGVSPNTVKLINSGKTWTHVKGIGARIRTTRKSGAKLDEHLVMQIKDLLIEGKLTFREIAEKFDLSEHTIYGINSGKLWNHVKCEGVKLRTTRKGGAKLDETQVMQIRDLLAEGKLTYKQIAERFGVSFATIRVINAGKVWTHVEGIGSKIRVAKKKGEGDVDLDESQVMKIRDLLIEGKLAMKEIGAMFGVSFRIIRLINEGEIWTHVEGIGSKIKTHNLGNAKLNEDQVMKIRDLLLEGSLTLKEIGKKFGVSHQTISGINEGQVWTNVEGIGSKIKTRMVSSVNNKSKNAKLTEDQVRRIRDLLTEEDLTIKEIAAIFGVSHNAISCINLGKTWTHVEGIGSKIRTKK
ncbi:MAG: hypothetical protein ACRC2V_12310 [Xenococcaceae cyanobacterium]